MKIQLSLLLALGYIAALSACNPSKSSRTGTLSSNIEADDSEDPADLADEEAENVGDDEEDTTLGARKSLSLNSASGMGFNDDVDLPVPNILYITRDSQEIFVAREAGDVGHDIPSDYLARDADVLSLNYKRTSKHLSESRNLIIEATFADDSVEIVHNEKVHTKYQWNHRDIDLGKFGKKIKKFVFKSSNGRRAISLNAVFLKFKDGQRNCVGTDGAPFLVTKVASYGICIGGAKCGGAANIFTHAFSKPVNIKSYSLNNHDAIGNVRKGEYKVVAVLDGGEEKVISERRNSTRRGRWDTYDVASIVGTAKVSSIKIISLGNDEVFLRASRTEFYSVKECDASVTPVDGTDPVAVAETVKLTNGDGNWKVNEIAGYPSSVSFDSFSDRTDLVPQTCQSVFGYNQSTLGMWAYLYIPGSGTLTVSLKANVDDTASLNFYEIDEAGVEGVNIQALSQTTANAAVIKSFYLKRGQVYRVAAKHKNVYAGCTAMVISFDAGHGAGSLSSTLKLEDSGVIFHSKKFKKADLATP